MEGLVITAARADEVEAVLRMLDESASWLLSRGIDQWHPREWPAERIGGAIARGETFLARSEGKVVGTISLQWIDEAFWPGAPEDAGYVHRLAVATSAHGRGIGSAMLAWAGHAISERQRRFVRLDCACANAQLRRYYESAGFRHRGDRTMTGSKGPAYCASLYEKQLGA